MIPSMPDENTSSKPALRKALGVFDGIAILIGICIGAGIYSTPQIIAGYLGSFKSILLLWLLAGLFVFTSGLIYAELGTRMPHTGGEYIYISRSFGRYAGFMFGWAQLFIIRTSAAAGLALIVADYLGYFIVLEGASRVIAALAVIFLFGILNYIGIQRASLFQKLSTILKVGALFAIILIGLFFSGGQENLLLTQAASETSLGPVGNVVAALMLIIFSHTGWERVGYPAGEMKNPRRVIPLSLFIGLGIVVLLYALTNLTYHRTGNEGEHYCRLGCPDCAHRTCRGCSHRHPGDHLLIRKHKRNHDDRTAGLLCYGQRRTFFQMAGSHPSPIPDSLQSDRCSLFVGRSHSNYPGNL